MRVAGLMLSLFLATCGSPAVPARDALLAAMPSATPVCTNPAQGPAEPPAGAVVVDPATDGDLYRKTQASPAGTTFWLSAGTHTLGTNTFGQVIPKNGNTYLGAPGSILDGRNINQAAFTQGARSVTIQFMTIQRFAAPRDQGVVNHDSGDDWTIADNVIQNNKGAGLMAGARQRVLRNCLRNNGQYGMNAYKSGNTITGLVVEGNEIVGNNTDDWEARVPGCGCTGGAKFWSVNGADVRDNWVHANRGPGLWADTNNNDFLVENNLVESNDSEGFFYEISYNLIFRNNTLKDNTKVKGKRFADRNDNFPVAAIYLSEAGGEPRVPARTDKIEIYGNVLENNWSGITAWENADRFCNSPANTSGGVCTKLVPRILDCAQPGIANPPQYSDCRWKTQRLDIHGNTFVSNPTAVGCTNGLCGRMALLSNFGTYPTWSPYKGFVVADAITFRQANVWRNNTYTGSWAFMAHDTQRLVNAATWQGSPYGQDAGSVFGGSPPPLPPPPPPPNLIVGDTATVEGGTGAWVSWFSVAITRSTEQAHGGTAGLKVTPTTNSGWGVQLSNYPGFAATAGPRTLRFWARAGTPTSVGGVVNMTVDWKNSARGTLASTSVSLPALSSTWQSATASVQAPAGTAFAFLKLTGRAAANSSFYLDDFYVG